MWRDSLLLIDFHLKCCILEGNLKMKSTGSYMRGYFSGIIEASVGPDSPPSARKTRTTGNLLLGLLEPNPPPILWFLLMNKATPNWYVSLFPRKVAVVPGAEFGADPFERLSYATSMGDIKEGLNRIEEALKKLS